MADVLHKETLEYRRSVHTPDYSPTVWFINPDLSSVEGVDPKYWKVEEALVREMSTAEKALAYLPEAQKKRCSEIDQKTQKLVAEGFVYEGGRYSLSLAAQLRISQTLESVRSASCVYPVAWNSLDDVTQVELATAGEVETFARLAALQVRTLVDSGTEFKAQVRQATSLAEIDAIADPR